MGGDDLHPRTVPTALLRERGLIETVHGRGTFVVAVPPDDRD